MLHDEMQSALNDQINAELYSAYIYLSMAAFFEARDLKGFASWMKAQAQEEVGHAMRIFQYIYDRGGAVTLQAIDGPPTEWDAPLAAFEAAYEHERHVTKLIHGLTAQADEASDYATRNMLEWFIDEQVEEESTADTIVQRLKLAGDNAGALLILDRELGDRRSTE
jgi:ferritin